MYEKISLSQSRNIDVSSVHVSGGVPVSEKKMFSLDIFNSGVFLALIQTRLPKVAAHFERCGMPLEPLTINWFLCLFINTLPLEATLRVWDSLFFEVSLPLSVCAMCACASGELAFCV